MKKITFLLFIFSCFTINAQDKTKTADNNNKFAFDIYQKVTKAENIFLSPYSISTALAMTYSGAGTTTAKEMAKVMHFDADYKKNDANFKAIIDGVNALNNDDLKISVANRLFGEKSFRFNEAFINDLKENYGAPLEAMDFKNNYNPERKKINKWVEEQTNNKIKDLLKEGVVNKITRLILVNAIYFYGDWANQFDSSKTTTKDFYLNKTDKISRKMMFQKKTFQYMEGDDFTALRMYYKGSTTYMEVYLPNAKDGIDQLEKKLTYDNYLKWQNSFGYHKVNVTFPKFKITCDFSLGETLKKMGMSIPFSDSADFLRMIEKDQETLKISEVVHKAFIDVSEKGTEAAAATAVIMITTTSAAPPIFEETKTFNADHPFIFMIKDKTTGSILFMGKVMKPE